MTSKPKPTRSNPVRVKVLASISDISASDWDACANPESAIHDPFVCHAFLNALEQAGTVTAQTGWIPQHLVLETDQEENGQRESGQGNIVGVMPAYLKLHSQGEFIFDHAWADAYTRAGGDYYPKLQAAIPFTPVPGRRLLTRPDPDEDRHRHLLAAAAIELARRHEASSLHITFASAREWSALGTDVVISAPSIETDLSAQNDIAWRPNSLNLLQRTGSQFHWQNDGYGCFEDFLSTLTSRKRKVLRKERRQALSAGITIRHLTGTDIKPHHWDAFYDFYLDTSNRKWGQAYLNREFFALLGETMAEQCLLIICEHDGRTIAGALNMIGGDCLYGRYWGAIEHHPFLHFEVCYYQAIDIAIERKLARVEAGAQGEHKLVRGYVPKPTYSLHWIGDHNFRAAVADYLTRERRHTEMEREALCGFTPFKNIVR